jgi:hypothetical protein
VNDGTSLYYHDPSHTSSCKKQDIDPSGIVLLLKSNDAQIYYCFDLAFAAEATLYTDKLVAKTEIRLFRHIVV